MSGVFVASAHPRILVRRWSRGPARGRSASSVADCGVALVADVAAPLVAGLASSRLIVIRVPSTRERGRFLADGCFCSRRRRRRPPAMPIHRSMTASLSSTADPPAATRVGRIRVGDPLACRDGHPEADRQCDPRNPPSRCRHIYSWLRKPGSARRPNSRQEIMYPLRLEFGKNL